MENIVEDKIYLDQNGRYYKAKQPKDAGDAMFNCATQDMFQYLTEVPVTLVEYHAILLKKDVPHDPQIKELLAGNNSGNSSKSLS